ncbi:hypothetical protein CDD82_2621 [Ophiocordyceps australis]|uniref:Uncharacterized protein n=1 Tax=Ophiocordyceps australis TaxID=1399860 RepID=A0A2C5XTR1_9HYPO|nr:hypothetical protein CDD82_2621 [Ophiocordyceps australis]
MSPFIPVNGINNVSMTGYYGTGPLEMSGRYPVIRSPRQQFSGPINEHAMPAPAVSEQVMTDQTDTEQIGNKRKARHNSRHARENKYARVIAAMKIGDSSDETVGEATAGSGDTDFTEFDSDVNSYRGHETEPEMDEAASTSYESDFDQHSAVGTPQDDPFYVNIYDDEDFDQRIPHHSYPHQQFAWPDMRLGIRVEFFHDGTKALQNGMYGDCDWVVMARTTDSSVLNRWLETQSNVLGATGELIPLFMIRRKWCYENGVEPPSDDGIEPPNNYSNVQCSNNGMQQPDHSGTQSTDNNDVYKGEGYDWEAANATENGF